MRGERDFPSSFARLRSSSTNPCRLRHDRVVSMDDSRNGTPAVNDDDALLKKVGQRIREERNEPEVPADVPAFDDAMADRLTAKLLVGPEKEKKDNVVR